MKRKRIRVLVAEGQREARALLAGLLGSDPEIEVAGSVADGEAALEFARTRRPDVMLISLVLPRLDGYETTRRVMEEGALPIVISVDADPKATGVAFRALEAGAVACVQRPGEPGDPNFASDCAHLIQMVKLMSEVRVVRRWPRARKPAATAPRPGPPRRDAVRVVAIGASTGGPPVLQAILSGLPKDFAVPILVVQHISNGFLPGLVDWLAQTTGLRILVASHGKVPAAGNVYLAPDDFHMGMKASGHIVLSREKPEHGVRPSVSFLFRSVAEACGARAVGILLSGMGKDGAAELRLMKDKGAVTIAQNRESSVIHGMPGAAIACDAATFVLPADRIADVVAGIAANGHQPRKADRIE